MGNFISSMSMSAEQALRGRDLTGKTVLITGGSSGIGLQICRTLALGGAKVYTASPNVEGAQEAIKQLSIFYGHEYDITPLALDLASFRSIRGFVERFKGLLGDRNLDVLILNAAVMQTPQWKTREGFEYQLGVNYLGHVELTTLLIEGVMLHAAMDKGLEGRVIVTTCRLPLDNAEKLLVKDLNYTVRPYSSGGAYAQSKVALAVWGVDLAFRLRQVPNFGVFIVNPGVSVTRLNRFLPFFSVIYDMAVAPFVKTTSQAAACTIHCATATRLVESENGSYFENCKSYKPPAILLNTSIAERLRAVTQNLLETAVVDSHQPIDYNPSKMVMTRVQEVILGPLMERFGWLLGHREKAH